MLTCMLNNMDIKAINIAREDIIRTAKKMAGQNMLPGSWGNLSIKIDDDTYAVTPSGRGYDNLTPQDITVVNAAGKTVDGSLIPSSELPLHLAIYKALPEAKAVVHTHSIYASACAAARKDIPPLVEDLVQIMGGPVHCAQYALPGTDELAANVIAAMHGRRAALMANHGVAAWGVTLDEAVMVAGIVEKAAQLYVLTQSIGGAVLLPQNDIDIMHSFYEAHYRKRQLGEE